MYLNSEVAQFPEVQMLGFDLDESAPTNSFLKEKWAWVYVLIQSQTNKHTNKQFFGRDVQDFTDKPVT